MKKVIIVFVLIIGCLTAQSQQKMICCESNAPAIFASNTMDEKFIQAHDNPIAFTLKNSVGHDINYTVSGGKEAHAWMVAAGRPTNTYLFVIHEWWGLNDFVKQSAEKLSVELGINVIALDLFDNKVASTREEASSLTQNLDKDRAMAIIHGAFKYVKSDAKIFTLGWCFGGGWSLQAAIEGGSQVAGCIMFYGQPELDPERLATIECDIIGFFGNQDKWPNPETVKNFEQVADKEKVNLTVHMYNAGHGFANPSNPVFNVEATKDAYEKVYAFIKERIQE